MAHGIPSTLFLATVYKWLVPGQKRVLDATSGTQYLLNTNSLTNLIDRPLFSLGKSDMYYFDNPTDHRDNSHYMVTSLTKAQVVTQMNTAMTHSIISLNVLPKDVPTATVEAHTFKVRDIAYACAVPDSYYASQSYIYVRENEGFKVVRFRVSHTLAAILALAA